MNNRESQIADQIRELDEKGYCVIEGVLAADKCATHKEGIERYLANCGIDVKDPALRHSEYPSIHGIIQHLEFGQSKAVWDVRQEESVAAVFERMFGDNDLLVSFDGGCVMLPYYTDNPNSRWWHVDQSHGRRGRRCIQGYVNLTDSHDEASGSLAVIVGSHKLHDKFGDENPAAVAVRDDWYKFTPEQLEALPGARSRVHGGVGSLVLWDSRTIHQNMAPPKTVAARRSRYVVYTCFQPRKLISKADLKKKQKAFDEYRMTTHWPASRVKLFSKSWRTYGKEAKRFPIVRDRQLSPRMLELAGKTALTTRTRKLAPPLLEFAKE